jgi:anti-sigma B factor antagonist
VATIRVQGEVDVSQAVVLRDTLAAGLAPGVIVLADLSEVPFIDSSGIGILVTAHRQAAACGGAFAVVSPSEQVSQVLRMTRADKMLHVYESDDAALSALRGE